METSKEESFKSSRGRHVKKRIVHEDYEEDDPPSKKLSIKAPPVFSFSDSDSESKNQVRSKMKNQACSIAKKNVEKKMSKKTSNLNVTKKNNIFKNNFQVNKKQAVRAELTSASRLKQSKFLINLLHYIYAIHIILL